MYLTGTSLLIKAMRERQLSGTFLRKEITFIFFDYRLVTTNDKYYQLIVEIVTNLIIR